MFSCLSGIYYKYMYVTEKAPFNEAQQICRNYGGRLARVTSSEVKDKLDMFFAEGGVWEGHPYVCLSVCVYVSGPTFCLSVCLCKIRPSVCPPVLGCLSISLSLSLSLWKGHSYVSQYVCLSVCLSLSLSLSMCVCVCVWSI